MGLFLVILWGLNTPHPFLTPLILSLTPYISIILILNNIVLYRDSITIRMLVISILCL